MKGRHLMDMVREARNGWQVEAECLAKDAIEHLRRAAEKGDAVTRFSLSREIHRRVINMARDILRHEAINLSYSPGRGGSELRISINQRMVNDAEADLD